MMKNNVLGYAGAGVNWLLALTSTNQVYQIIEVVLAVITTLVTVAFTVYKWYKYAKADGKITQEEIEDLKEKIKEDLEDGNNS